MNFEHPKSSDFQEKRGPENSVYDLAPELSLQEIDADVSYEYDGVYRERHADIYRDQNGNTWFEIKKSPRKQMLISLLSQPFFNISTVIEAPRKQGILSKFFLNLDPKIVPFFKSIAKILPKSSPTFLSKELDPQKTQEKSPEQIVADYLVFKSVFECLGDRDLERGHNVKRWDSTYALFDFDDSKIVPLKYFAHSKDLNFLNRPPADGMDQYIHKIKYYLSCLKESYEDTPQNYGGNRDFKTNIPFIATIEETVKKLKEIKEFFEGDAGEQFVQAVLKKTKYEEEYKKAHKKELKEGVLDEAYFNPHEIAGGLLAQVSYSSRVLLKELKEYYNENGKGQAKTSENIPEKYRPLLLELEVLGNFLPLESLPQEKPHIKDLALKKAGFFSLRP